MPPVPGAGHGEDSQAWFTWGTSPAGSLGLCCTVLPSARGWGRGLRLASMVGCVQEGIVKNQAASLSPALGLASHH